MEENLNNNEVNNNPMPHNDYYEPKKNGTKVLLIILIIIGLVLIGLLSYKMFVLDKKDVKEESNKTGEKVAEKISYEVKTENNLKYLYVNGKKVSNLEGTDIKVKELKDVLVVEWLGETVYSNGVVYVTSDGIVNAFKYLDNSYGSKLPNNRLSEYKVLEDSVEFVVTRDDGFDNSTGWMCEANEIAKYTKSYKYLGNGKFDNGIITNEVTTKEAYPNADGCNSEKVEPLSINSAEAKKYYGYVSSNGRFVYDTFDKELNYILESKNSIAYDKVLRLNVSLIQTKKCSLYADYIEKNIGDNWFCDGVELDAGDEERSNRANSATVSVIKNVDMKNAVEVIFGKGNYKAETFNKDGPYNYYYKEDTSEYIGVHFPGGGTGPTYTTSLIKAEKDDNHLYLYEKFIKNDYDDENAKPIKKEVGTMKHTFEKNSYDNNYHYVKSEKGE